VEQSSCSAVSGIKVRVFAHAQKCCLHGGRSEAARDWPDWVRAGVAIAASTRLITCTIGPTTASLSPPHPSGSARLGCSALLSSPLRDATQTGRSNPRRTPTHGSKGQTKQQNAQRTHTQTLVPALASCTVALCVLWLWLWLCSPMQHRSHKKKGEAATSA
jgi:hypothetical protein